MTRPYHKFQASLAFVAPLGFAIGWLSLPTSVNAQTAPRSFTPSQLQQLRNDLIRTQSEDFFREGAEQFEREIELLTREIFLSSESLLKVDPNLQMETDLTQFEAPLDPTDLSKPGT